MAVCVRVQMLSDTTKQTCSRLCSARVVDIVHQVVEALTKRKKKRWLLRPGSRMRCDNRPSQPIAVSLLCLRFILWPMCRLCVRVCVVLLCASLLHAVYPPPPLPVTACPYRTANSALHPPPPDPALCSLSCVRMRGWSHPSNSAPPVLIFPLPTRTRARRRLPDEVQQQRRLQ